MAKRGEFGHVIPSLGEIEKIDGKKLIDGDGDEWTRGLLDVNKDLGGGWQLASMDKKATKKSPNKK